MYSAVPKTGSTLLHWALSLLGEKYNDFKVVGLRFMPMYEDKCFGYITLQKEGYRLDSELHMNKS